MNKKAQPIWKKLAWMAAIWAGSVLVLGMVSYSIRLLLQP